MNAVKRMVWPVLATTLISVSAIAGTWNEANNPAKFEKTLGMQFEYRYDKLPLKAMLSDKKMPWSDNYWAGRLAGISYRWADSRSKQLASEGKESSFAQLFQYRLYTKEELLQMSPAQIATLSPAEKYDIYMGRYDFPTVQSERKRNSPKMEGWEGLCHGWIQAAIHHTEPNPVTVTNADGITIPFGTSDITGLLTYYYAVPTYEWARGHHWASHYADAIQYLDALDPTDGNKWVDITESTPALIDGYLQGPSQLENTLVDTQLCGQDYYLKNTFTAQTYIPNKPDLNATYKACRKRDDQCRYNVVEYAFSTMRNDIQSQCYFKSQKFLYFPHLDEVAQVGLRVESRGFLGNIFGGRIGIKDINPGAFHVLLGNMIGLNDTAFGANIHKYLRNGQVWNQPVIGYEMRILRGGADDIEVEDELDNAGMYEDNENRARVKRSVKIEVTVHYVKEIYQHRNPVVGTSAQFVDSDKFRYRLDLDRDGKIIGGSWAKRADHPNFAWIQKPQQFRGYWSKISELYRPRW